jgi:SPP1 gp7 family putative phage head morphogenesis protein
LTALTANEQLVDALIRHQIYLLRYGTGVGGKIVDLLNETERDLKEVIARRGARLVGRALTESVTQQRLKLLLAEVREIRQRAISGAFSEWRKSLTELIKHEAQYIQVAAQTVVPFQLDTVTPEPAVLHALVTHTVFEGNVLSGWANNIARADLNRISTQIKTGIVRGESTQAMASRVVGTVATRGANGVTEITRRDAMSITRTAVQAMSNAARQAVYEHNFNVFTKERFVATLDSRTTPICRAQDGHIYKRGEGPIPPLHFNCRSVRVPYIDPKLAGQRPARSGTERAALREYAAKNGLSNVRSRNNLPHGHKGDFDDFLRSRMRQLTGTVPANTTYAQFLGRQSAGFQDEVLGATRGALFRRGGLPLDRFVDNAGRQYTLVELARREAEAFRRAGLDPGNWGG